MAGAPGSQAMEVDSEGASPQPLQDAPRAQAGVLRRRLPCSARPACRGALREPSAADFRTPRAESRALQLIFRVAWAACRDLAVLCDKIEFRNCDTSVEANHALLRNTTPAVHRDPRALEGLSVLSGHRRLRGVLRLNPEASTSISREGGALVAVRPTLPRGWRRSKRRSEQPRWA